MSYNPSVDPNPDFTGPFEKSEDHRGRQRRFTESAYSPLPRTPGRQRFASSLPSQTYSESQGYYTHSSWESSNRGTEKGQHSQTRPRGRHSESDHAVNMPRSSNEPPTRQFDGLRQQSVLPRPPDHPGSLQRGLENTFSRPRSANGRARTRLTYAEAGDFAGIKTSVRDYAGSQSSASRVPNRDRRAASEEPIKASQSRRPASSLFVYQKNVYIADRGF